MPGVDEIDLSIGGVGSFALSSVHRCWTADPAVHESAGPHGVTGVRTFYNDVIVASLRAGNAVHPRGSILVKELYDGEAIDGYAVNIKVEDGEGSDRWLFFEGFAPTFAGFYGRAEPLCAGCHVGGRDHVLSQLPP
jgi:hypothetical protein